MIGGRWFPITRAPYTELQMDLDDVYWYHIMKEHEEGYKKMKTLIEREIGPHGIERKKKEKSRSAESS